MSSSWQICEPPPSLDRLVEALGLSPLMLRLLWARDLRTPETIEHFLNAGADRLTSPFELPGIESACRRLFDAQKSGELVMIHGDYDVDGVTASAIMVRAFRRLGVRFITYVPHRKSGYGFGPDGLAFALEKKVNLILTLDCGITSHEEVAAARAAGIDTIIVDHHQIPRAGAPAASAIVNPWLDVEKAGDFLELSAAGLAFELAAALLGDEAHTWVGLAAIGTVADVAPLTGENRIIVKMGLKTLEKKAGPGLTALMKEAALHSSLLTARHIGFVIGPRLNAGGRMDTAEDALGILTTDTADEAARLAQILEKRNNDRRAVEKKMVEEAVRQCEREMNFNRDRVIVLWNESWHPGVIGIVAARLVDRYYRPAIVIGLENGRGKGSCRSIRGFHMHEALKAAADELLEFGGHEYAAGFLISADRLDSFRKTINQHAHSVLDPKDLLRPFKIDAEISFGEITAGLLNQIVLLAPFGSGNPEPLFLTRRLRLKEGAVRSNNRFSSRMWVTDGQGVFQLVVPAERARDMTAGEVFDLVYSVRLDRWQGEELISLHAKDVKWLGSS